MNAYGFEHIQGSVYASKASLRKTDVARFLRDLLTDEPYLSKCVRDIRQTDVGNTYSLNRYFDYDGTPGEYKTKAPD